MSDRPAAPRRKDRRWPPGRDGDEWPPHGCWESCNGRGRGRDSSPKKNVGGRRKLRMWEGSRCHAYAPDTRTPGRACCCCTRYDLEMAAGIHRCRDQWTKTTAACTPYLLLYSLGRTDSCSRRRWPLSRRWRRRTAVRWGRGRDQPASQQAVAAADSPPRSRRCRRPTPRPPCCGP